MNTGDIKKSELLKFLKQMKKHSQNIDDIMKTAESSERGKFIAREMNAFDIILDAFIHFQCGVSLKALRTFISRKTL